MSLFWDLKVRRGFWMGGLFWGGGGLGWCALFSLLFPFDMGFS